MSHQSPIFTIIVPTYNRPQQLRPCLQAISELDYPRDQFEVIVVDDGGRQDLTDVCSPHESEIQLSLIRKTNSGPASARNMGADHAKGTYLAFTDDDCELEPGWLANLEMLFTRHPRSMIGGRSINKLDDNIYSRTSQLIVDIVYRHYNSQEKNARFITSNNMAIPRDLFEQIGGFDLSFFAAASEDRELCSRWLANGFNIIYDQKPIIYHSHELNLGGFCMQHFTYGRGAYCFRKIQRSRGWGYFREEIRFHMNINNWLLYPFRSNQGSAWNLALLLLIWQFANASGFIWQAMHEVLFSSTQGKR